DAVAAHVWQSAGDVAVAERRRRAELKRVEPAVEAILRAALEIGTSAGTVRTAAAAERAGLVGGCGQEERSAALAGEDTIHDPSRNHSSSEAVDVVEKTFSRPERQIQVRADNQPLWHIQTGERSFQTHVVRILHCGRGLEPCRLALGIGDQLC